MAVLGGLDTVLHICAVQRNAKVTGPWSCVSMVFSTVAHCCWQRTMSPSRASVRSALLHWTLLDMGGESPGHPWPRHWGWVLPSCPVLAAKSMDMQYLSPWLSPESGVVPVNGIRAVMTKSPTTAALMSRGGMESDQLICSGLWTLKYIRIMLLYLNKVKKEKRLHRWTSSIFLTPTQSLRALRLAMVNAQNHSYTGTAGPVVLEHRVPLSHAGRSIPMGWPGWWPRLSCADASPQAASLCKGNPSLPLKDSFPLTLEY